MTSYDPDEEWVAEYLLGLAQQPDDNFPNWTDARDLGRLHRQAFVRDRVQDGPVDRSRGRLRLTGGGVHNHSLSMQDAGVILAEFQTLVTSAGAWRNGIKTQVGRLPQSVIDSTRLLLNASPAPGSVILEFEPDAGSEQSAPEMMPLIEESIELAFDVLALAAHPDSPQVATTKFWEWGPRIASAARDFMQTAAKADFDVTATWERPLVGRKTVRVSAEESANFSRELATRPHELFEEKITGVLRTVSDRRKVEMEVPDTSPDVLETQIVSIDRHGIDFSPYRVGDRLSIWVAVTRTLKAGAGETVDYSALGVESLDGHRQQRKTKPIRAAKAPLKKTGLKKASEKGPASDASAADAEARAAREVRTMMIDRLRGLRRLTSEPQRRHEIGRLMSAAQDPRRVALDDLVRQVEVFERHQTSRKKIRDYHLRKAARQKF